MTCPGKRFDAGASRLILGVGSGVTRPFTSRRAFITGVAAACIATQQAEARDRRNPWRVLIYGASNAWGYLPRIGDEPLQRLPFSRRWPGVAQRRLGRAYEIVEDTLPGRTAGIDRPGFGGLSPSEMNGLTELPAALLRNLPLHLVVLQLGTNDLMIDPDIAPEVFAGRIGRLAKTVTDFRLPVAMTGMTLPMRVLVMTPPPIGDTPGNPNGLRAEAKRRLVQPVLAALAAEQGFALFDSAVAAMRPGPDGLHFDVAAHTALGESLARAIRALA